MQEPLVGHGKKIALDVTYHALIGEYVVTKITNSLFYKPGQKFNHDEMRQIILHPDFDPVTITDFDYISAVANLVGSAIGMGLPKPL